MENQKEQWKYTAIQQRNFSSGFMTVMEMWNLRNCTVRIFWNTKAI